MRAYTYVQARHRLFGCVGAAIAFAVAIIYSFVIPTEARAHTGVVSIILTYGHALCWVLLGVASALWAHKRANRWQVRLLYAALFVYTTFLATLLVAQYS